MESVDCNDASTSTAIPWSYQTNWIIAHGSLESSVGVESSDDPIEESDPECTVTRSPLILKPRGPDSGPCEIKICFKQKYEVRQIYVLSTARSYEVYYEKSPHSINEYFTTVRCGVAVRDDKVLQTTSVGDVSCNHGECSSSDVVAETASNGGSPASSEDEWVKIKVPEASRIPASDKIAANGLNNIQDLHEATAEISDSDPCSSLTIRLLSLQDKGYVYLDEIYVFVDPVESMDDGNKAELGGSSAQSSLMAMFMPTLLQLSRSGISQIQDKNGSDKVVNNGKIEATPTVMDRIDSPQQVVQPKELGKDVAESAETQQLTSATKCIDTKTANNFETAMEQLISRLGRVEDICLRFEEKMLKPIERIEARLQQVEHQLEKLSKSSHDTALPRCTRISVPKFPCSESNSNSASFYNDELKKEDFARDENFHPGLIIRAPEFSCGEGDEDSDDLKPLKDSSYEQKPIDSSPEQKPKKTLSVDAALAAALSGFLSTAIGPSEPAQSDIALPSDVNEEIKEIPSAENVNREATQYTLVLTIKAPDFTAEETDTEEKLNTSQSSLDTSSMTENEKTDQGNEMGPSSIGSKIDSESADESRGFDKNERSNEFCSENSGESSAQRSLGNGEFNGSSIVNIIETYFEGDATEISNVSATNSADESRDCSENPISQYAASEEKLGHETETVSEDMQKTVEVESFEERISNPSRVDLDFPILEVKFNPNVDMISKSPLEALLVGEEEESLTTEEVDGNETTEILSTNGLLLDLEASAPDVTSNLENESHSSEEIAVSLI